MIYTLYIPGGDYRVHHVMALARQVKLYLNEPLKVLTTDTKVLDRVPNAVPVEINRLGGHAWWSKLLVFKQARRGVFLDLDTILVGPAYGLMNFETEFQVIEDVYRKGRWQSSVFAWDGDYSWLIDAPRNMAEEGLGDQAHLEWCLRGKVDWAFWEETHPKLLRSWKVDCQKSIPPGCRVVFFHGHPRPWDAPGWPQAYYETLLEAV